MDVFGTTIPLWVLDWSGSALVVASLVFLFRKHLFYWHLSNASLLPYFLLFVSGRQFMLAGLQVSYLIFGAHGLVLWTLEQRRSAGGPRFNEMFWYNLGWVLSLAIFGYTIAVTSFSDRWAWLQFTIVSLSLVANLATTRKWAWSWPVWIVVNALQTVFFAHANLWGQFGLQFVLAAMSVYGWITWVADDRASSSGAASSGPSDPGAGVQYAR